MCGGGGAGEEDCRWVVGGDSVCKFVAELFTVVIAVICCRIPAPVRHLMVIGDIHYPVSNFILVVPCFTTHSIECYLN